MSSSSPKYTEFLGQRVIIAIKNVFVSTKEAQASGFKNAMVIGTLLDETDDGLYIGEGGDLSTVIPLDSVGVLMTNSTEFFAGLQEIELPNESEIN